MNFDLVITNGTVIDGTGRPRFRADLGILNGRIAAIATGERLAGQQTINATGLVVAPGFVDAHSHADWILPLPDHDQILTPFVLQGITTMVTGNCGFSVAPISEESIPVIDEYSEMLRERAFPYRWRSLAEFLDTLEHDGILLNAAFLVGHGVLRYVVMGDRTGIPTPEEIDALCHLTRESIRGGAFGLSAGLGYVPGVFAQNAELLPLLKTTAHEGGIYAVHARSYQWTSPFYETTAIPHNVLSNREQLDLARQSGVRIQLSHLIFNGRHTWPTYRTVLQDIEQAANEGLDVAFDAFPYTFGNSTIKVLFPPWFLDGFEHRINDPESLKRLKDELTLRLQAVGRDYQDITLLWSPSPDLSGLEGLNFAAIARFLGLPGYEAYMHVAKVSNGKARILHGPFSGDNEYEEPLRAVLSHPLCAFMADTVLTRRGKHNPASFGAFPRLLGRYSRDLGLFSLEEAVRRMTSFSAERIGLADVGTIAEGLWADLVLFDPETVADNTTPDRLDAPPTGIRAVLISGQVIAQDGRIIAQRRYGRVLRR
jgi:N-acyl-D-amino-acid deacylase